MRGRMHQTLRLAGEEQLEQPRALAKRHAAKRAADADQRGPEDDAGQILVTEQDEPQPGKERKWNPYDVTNLFLHCLDGSARVAHSPNTDCHLSVPGKARAWAPRL